MNSKPSSTKRSPALDAEATARIETYASALARASGRPYAPTEDARRELVAHLEDLASESATRQGSPAVEERHVEEAIASLGPSAGVGAAFFDAAPDPARPGPLLREWRGRPVWWSALLGATAAFILAWTANSTLTLIDSLRNFDGQDWEFGAAILGALLGVGLAFAVWLERRRSWLVIGVLLVALGWLLKSDTNNWDYAMWTVGPLVSVVPQWARAAVGFTGTGRTPSS